MSWILFLPVNTDELSPCVTALDGGMELKVERCTTVRVMSVELCIGIPEAEADGNMAVAFEVVLWLWSMTDELPLEITELLKKELV